jgi:hypothetical protein
LKEREEEDRMADVDLVCAEDLTGIVVPLGPIVGLRVPLRKH